MTNQSGLTRQPWVAAVLSLMCTGLGHLYCGNVAKGLILFLVSLLFAPTVVLAALATPSTAVLWGIFICAVSVWAVYLYATVDAFRVARRLDGPYTKRDYNHVAVYGLFVLVGVIYPVGSALLVRETVFEAFFVPARSMSPSVRQGDRVLANKLASRGAPPDRGKVVVFRAPGQREMRYIKRVIGLPGDTVSLLGDDVYVNGKKLERDRVPPSRLSPMQAQVAGQVFTETSSGARYLVMLDEQTGASTDFSEITVPEDTVFVLGDNRHHSRDSREFGCIPVGDLLGTVQYIYWPAESWGRLGRLDG
jgi:signal peptidase I